MRRFRFRLETALRLRQIALERARTQLAAGERQVLAIEESLRLLRDDQRRHQDYQATLLAGTADVALLRAAALYAEALDEDRVQQQSRLAAACVRRETLREELQQRRAEQEALARLRQRRLDEHRAHEAACEQAALDDGTVMRWGRE